MNEPRPESQIPCVIENGIIYSLRDIYRVIRDMGQGTGTFIQIVSPLVL